jgi:7,8-dihydropterin-6-yl-methyl-4-(beta-D-ribofuranosyl)aminobenzene 5'-phosphate synthase
MTKEGLNRREFLKMAGVGGVVLAAGSHVSRTMSFAETPGREDFGQCKSVKIRCISEVGWIDGQKLLKDMGKSGGPKANQWRVDWDPANSGGCCNLIEVETLDGKKHKFLVDTGWNNEYMETVFKREGIDKMLRDKEIEFLYITHEHFDHFFGLETTLKYNPDIKIIIPSTFYDEGYHFLEGAEFMKAKARNRIPHKGELVKHEPGKVYKLYPGCASVTFDLPIVVRVRGEQSLYFNVKDKGLVCVTGCCHQNVLTYVDFAQKKLVGGDNLYALYGGLHIAPIGPLNAEGEQMVKGMAKYNFKKVACNHCTGVSAVQKMIELGYPVVKGTARNGSTSNLYLGNGDEILFG